MSEQDNEKETLETTTEEVANTEGVEETVADTETEDASKLKELNKKLFERAKKAETELKTLKKSGEQQKQNLQTNTHQSEEDVFQAVQVVKDLDAEELKELRAISKGKGISLAEAKNDPLFTAFQSVKAEEQRKEKAKLGASKGSGQKEEKGFKPGMTAEEHKAQWAKMMGE